MMGFIKYCSNVQYMALGLHLLWTLSVVKHVLASSSQSAVTIQFGFESECMNIIETLQCNEQHHCLHYCLTNMRCTAYVYEPDTKDCNLLRNKLNNIRKVAGSTNIYGFFIDRADDNDDGQCNTNDSNEPSTPDETHILIFMGQNASGQQQDIIDFIPETNNFTILITKAQYKSRSRNVGVWGEKVIVNGGTGSASFEVFDSMPLVELTNNVVPKIRYYGCGGVAHDKFYACFGRLPVTDAVKTCDVYDLSNNYAHTTLNMQLSIDLLNMACIFKDDYLYTVGGSDDDSGEYINYFNRFSLNNGTRFSLPNYPIEIEGPGAVLYHGNIVVCGGGPPVNNVCHLFNFTSAQWQSFASLNTATQGHSCVNWGLDRILCMGGYGSGYYNKVELFENGTWIDYANMPYAMYGHVAVVVEG